MTRPPTRAASNIEASDGRSGRAMSCRRRDDRHKMGDRQTRPRTISKGQHREAGPGRTCKVAPTNDEAANQGGLEAVQSLQVGSQNGCQCTVGTVMVLPPQVMS